MTTPRLSRRLMAKAGLAYAGFSLRASAAENPIRTAEAFVDSVGVNIHLGSGFYVSRFERFRDLIGASLIRHVRDEVRPGNDLARWGQLTGALGLRAHLLVSPVTADVPQILAFIQSLGVDRITAIEGQNEGDSDWFKAQKAAHGNWGEAVTAFQREVFHALRPRYPASSLPIVSPSIIDWKPGDVAAIRACAPFCDVVALHSYVQQAQEPETDDDFSGLSWYLKNMRDPFKPGAPVMTTEAGYSNFLTKKAGGGVSEAASAIYLPRLLLNNFGAGVLRTFLYVFMDGDEKPDNGEQHWGLARSDGTPKPAYHAIRALLAALIDRGPAVDTLRPGPPVLATLPTATPELRSLPLRMRDGGLVLALWRAVPSWDRERGADLAVVPQPLDVLPDRALARVERLVPNDGGSWSRLPTPAPGQPMTLPVGDKVVLLRLSARAG